MSVFPNICMRSSEVYCDNTGACVCLGWQRREGTGI